MKNTVPLLHCGVYYSTCTGHCSKCFWYEIIESSFLLYFLTLLRFFDQIFLTSIEGACLYLASSWQLQTWTASKIILHVTTVLVFPTTAHQ